jgi:hypothetical protein
MERHGRKGRFDAGQQRWNPASAVCIRLGKRESRQEPSSSEVEKSERDGLSLFRDVLTVC